MTKVIIRDCQTGEFSVYTSVNDLWESCREDYIANSPEELEIEGVNDYINSFSKIEFIEDVYEYKVIKNPDFETIREWETQTGKKF
ncbi:hypothetical protein 015DV002_21 [Bacillus phage 015DV002]|nr:hypothetical protein 000TH008_23 [Bacillus phage 000TH008]QQO40717.1 hypothetical protein 000TH009_23 [Bacillus phage 000TH009]QQO40978.1 hypothetical protein 015DV002_21 [Bacillus phage 015DV002]QQO41239.1 hypothetical protein 015DV004_23 [Bacillus phage 015DV004]